VESIFVGFVFSLARVRIELEGLGEQKLAVLLILLPILQLVFSQVLLSASSGPAHIQRKTFELNHRKV
jgi:hypothetical protein